MAQIYKNTGRLTPARSVFDLSYDIKGTTDMGYLIPVMCKSCCPGDIMEIGQELVIRFNPLVAPILHEINAFTWTFFVPYRLIDEDFEEFISGGWDGQSLPHGSHPISLPLWSGRKSHMYNGNIGGIIGRHNTLWDHLGFPKTTNPDAVITTNLPIDYPLRAYNFIYTNYMRDENLEPEIEYPYDRQAVSDADQDPEKPGNGTYHLLMGWDYTNLFWGNYEKDYFTVALPFQQRGPSPALALYGTADINDTIAKAIFSGFSTGSANPIPNSNINFGNAPTSPNDYGAIPVESGSSGPNGTLRALRQELGINKVTGIGAVDLSKATAGDINDLRWSFQLQKFMERNARIGARYVEILHGRYGQPLQDVRLDRPEYIGGSRSPIIVSEVLQTSESDSSNPSNGNQTGSMRGHGISADKTFIGRYKVREFGLIMTLMCIKPRTAYNSQGIDREWTPTTPYDLVTPEFVNLSEQGVRKQEIYWDATSDEINQTIDGFEGRYDEYRTANSKTCGLMRDDLLFWHLARNFITPPNITSPQFIKINPGDTKRIFAVQNVDGIIYNFANVIKAIRPLPIIAEPGLIDHH